jgi:hypothetical protein
VEHFWQGKSFQLLQSVLQEHCKALGAGSPQTLVNLSCVECSKKCPLVNLSCVECSKKKFNQHYKWKEALNLDPFEFLFVQLK